MPRPGQLLCAQLVALWAMGCAQPIGGSADEGALPLVKPGAFTFAVSGEYRPFSYVDADQQLAGFDVEVGRALARELGLKPRPKKYKFAAIVEGVKTGRFDAAVASHTITPERRAQVGFTTPYYFSGPQIFVRPGSPIEEPAGLEGREVAVSKGSTFSRMAAEQGAEVKVYDNDITALEALDNGRHDAVITDSVTGTRARKAGLDVEGRELFARSEQGVAVAKDRPALLAAVDQALGRLRTSGELARLSERTFGENITAPPEGWVASAGGRAGLDEGGRENPVAHFFDVLSESRGVFAKGAVLTVALTSVAILFGSLIGLLFAFLKLSRTRALQGLAQGYITLVRGTPLIVQIFILYFGLTNLVRIPAFWAASLALAFHNGAYIAEIFRGAIQSIDRGQMEAGLSLGMTRALTYQRVILPQAGLRAIPPLGNQFIIGLKDSSLAAFISMNELFNVATTQGANHFDQMTYLLVVAVYYLALVMLLSLVVRLVEDKLSEGIMS